MRSVNSVTVIWRKSDRSTRRARWRLRTISEVGLGSANPSGDSFILSSCACFAPMLFIGGDDALHQRMTDDVAFAELDHADAFDFAKRLLRLDESGLFVRREIDLGDVSSDDGF